MADRDPCPHRIVGDVGGAFGFGLVGGGVWHSVKGFRNSPKGQGTQGALKAAMVRGVIASLFLGVAFFGGITCSPAVHTAVVAVVVHSNLLLIV